MSRKPRPLKPEFVAFIDHYLTGKPGVDCVKAIRGDAISRPDVRAAHILARADVKAEIARRLAIRSARYEVTAEKIIKRLALIALGDMRELFDPTTGRLRDVHELTEEAAAQLAGVDVEKLFEYEGRQRTHIGYTVKIRQADAIRAAELLGKNIGLFKERVEHSGPGGKPLAPPVFNFGFKNGGPGGKPDPSAEG